MDEYMNIKKFFLHTAWELGEIGMKTKLNMLVFYVCIIRHYKVDSGIILNDETLWVEEMSIIALTVAINWSFNSKLY